MTEFENLTPEDLAERPLGEELEAEDRKSVV